MYIYSTDGYKVGRQIGNFPIAFEEGEDPVRTRPIRSELSNGAVFLGQTRHKAVDGRGSMTFWGAQIPASRMVSYTGQFKLNSKHGVGHMTWEDESSFQGIWIDDEICGPGLLHPKDGSTCAGDFLQGKLHGFGVKTLADGSAQVARFQHGEPEGEIWNYPPGTSDPDDPTIDFRKVESGCKKILSQGIEVTGAVATDSTVMSVYSGLSLKEMAFRAAQRGRAAAGACNWERALAIAP